MEFRLFGTFEVQTKSGARTTLRARKEKWLLALLVLRPERDVPRDWLAATLWPDTEESQGLFYLRKTLSNLRNVLGDEANRLLSPTPRTLRLDLSGTFCDVLAFDTLLAQDTTPEESLQQAIQLYRGPLLQECLEEWVFAERHQREQSYLAALERLAALTLERGKPASTVRWLRLVLATEPYRESAACSLMQALAQSGDRAALQQVYQELRTRLHEDLNATPSPETEALYQRLCKQEVQSVSLPSPSPSSASQEPSLRHLPVPLTDLIGREAEITEVVGWLGRGRLVTLLGPGGRGQDKAGHRGCGGRLAEFSRWSLVRGLSASDGAGARCRDSVQDGGVE